MQRKKNKKMRKREREREHAFTQSVKSFNSSFLHSAYWSSEGSSGLVSATFSFLSFYLEKNELTTPLATAFPTSCVTCCVTWF